MMARGGGGSGDGVGVDEGVDVTVGVGVTAPRVAAVVAAAEPQAERTAAAATMAARCGFIENPIAAIFSSRCQRWNETPTRMGTGCSRNGPKPLG
jgi:hypothetical protein